MSQWVWFLLQKLLDQATSPVVKAWLMDELKKLDDATTNPYFKALIEALERFLQQQSPSAPSGTTPTAQG